MIEAGAASVAPAMTYPSVFLQAAAEIARGEQASYLRLE